MEHKKVARKCQACLLSFHFETRVRNLHRSFLQTVTSAVLNVSPWLQFNYPSSPYIKFHWELTFSLILKFSSLWDHGSAEIFIVNRLYLYKSPNRCSYIWLQNKRDMIGLLPLLYICSGDRLADRAELYACVFDTVRCRCNPTCIAPVPCSCHKRGC